MQPPPNLHRSPGPGVAQRLGKYILLSPLSSPWADQLSEAYDPALDRRVLIERLPSEQAWRDALALAQLDHLYILRAFDVSPPAPAGLGYVAFALPPGGTLADRLTDARFRRRFLPACLWQVGQALAAAHAHGFVHRGLLAASVLLSSDGQAQVRGFTVAPTAQENERGQARDLQSFEALIAQAWDRPRWLRQPAPQAVAERLRHLQAQLQQKALGGPRSKWIAAGLAIALAAGGVPVGLHVRALRRCQPLKHEVAALWSGSRSGTVQQALLRTGKPYAIDAARRVGELVVSYLSSLASLELSLCAPQRGSGPVTEAVRDLRLACLQGQLRKLDATLSVLEEADGQTAQGAVSLVEDRLSAAELEECLRLTQGLTPAPPPLHRAAAVAQARQALARGEALGHAGKYQEVRALLAPTVSRADQTQYLPVQAEASLWRGQMGRRLGEFDDSIKWLHRAASLADGCRHDRVAAQAWLELVFVIGDRKADPKRATEYARFAEASLHRCPSCDDLWPAYYEQLGNLRYQQGAISEALPLQNEALARRQRLHAPAAELMRSYNSLGNILDSLERAAEAADYHKRALTLAEKEYGPAHPQVAVYLRNLAHSQESLGQLAAAQQNAERALAITQQALGPQHPTLGRIESLLGGVLMEAGHYPQARTHLGQAIAHLENNPALGPHHPLIAQAYINLGTLEQRSCRHAEALAAFSHALRLREAALSLTHLELSFALLGMARAQIGLKDQAAAALTLSRTRSIMDHSEEKQAAQQELRASLWFTEALYHVLAKKKREPDAQARQLAERARVLYQTLGDGFRYELAELDRFVAPP